MLCFPQDGGRGGWGRREDGSQHGVATDPSATGICDALSLISLDWLAFALGVGVFGEERLEEESGTSTTKRKNGNTSGLFKLYIWQDFRYSVRYSFNT